MDRTSALTRKTYTAQAAAAKLRYRPLGALRLSLAFLVMFQHCQHLLSDGSTVFTTLGLGAVAVCVFFTISGFVVAEANAAIYAGRPAAFLANRLLRLIPPYFAALAVSILVQTICYSSGHLTLWDYPDAGRPFTAARLLSGAAGLLPGLHTLFPGDSFEFIPFAWSLRAEMAFYAAALVALMLAAGAAAAMAAILLAALAASLAFLSRGQPGLLSCAPMFLSGTALYLVLRQATPARLAYLTASLAAAALGFASWRQHGHPDLHRQFLLTGLLLALVAALAVAPAGTWQRLDRRLGDLSYPLYLNHYAVGIALASLTSRRGPALFGAGIVLSLLLAIVMNAVVDQRLARWRTRIRGTRL